MRGYPLVDQCPLFGRKLIRIPPLLSRKSRSTGVSFGNAARASWKSIVTYALSILQPTFMGAKVIVSLPKISMTFTAMT